MIAPFNREELLITYDLNRLNQARTALAGAGVDYTYRFKDLSSPSFGDARGRRGTLGMNQEARVEYRVYVRKKDLERAREVMRGV